MRKMISSRKTLTCCVVGGLVIALGWLELSREQTAARGRLSELECVSRLDGLFAGIRDYCSLHGSLPPAYVSDASGVPAHSWRVLILRSGPIGHDGFYRRYSFALSWDSAENRPLLHDSSGDFMACPSDHHAATSRATSYVAVVGEETMWPGPRGRTREELEGNEDRILVIEIPRTDIAWMEPRDITLDEAIRMYSEWDGFRDANHRRGLHYLTLDGKVHSFSEIANKEEFARLLRWMPKTDRKGVRNEWHCQPGKFRAGSSGKFRGEVPGTGEKFRGHTT